LSTTGRVAATREIHEGQSRVSESRAVERRTAEINSQTGVVFFDAESRAVLVIGLDIAGGQAIAVRTITNPDKLRHLERTPSRVAH
jgi:RNA polymerase sigma-70 factor (ECF subfamily)